MLPKGPRHVSTVQLSHTPLPLSIYHRPLRGRKTPDSAQANAVPVIGDWQVIGHAQRASTTVRGTAIIEAISIEVVQPAVFCGAKDRQLGREALVMKNAQRASV